MIHSKRGLIISGLLALLLGLVILFPARIAIGWFAPAELAIGGIQGSAWRGSASEASVNGIYVRNLKWRLNPLRLFTGNLSYNVAAIPVSGIFESDISIGFGGVLSLTDLNVELPLDLFADALGVSGLQGDANLRFARVEIVDDLAVAADGVVLIENLVVPIVTRESLGGYKAEFFTQNNGIAASIFDTNGVLDIKGSLQIRTDRSFAFIAQVKATAATPQGVRQQLRFLPPANNKGQQELRLEGIL